MLLIAAALPKMISPVTLSPARHIPARPISLISPELFFFQEIYKISA